MRSRAILFGPFLGELDWEFFRFAPHAIYLKKREIGTRIVVLTRPSSFDLYGQYADILVPLRIKNDSNMNREGFKLLGYEEEYYNTLIKYFRVKFRKRFNIIKHKFPDVSLWRYKVKWQFHRDEMDYDFKPREENIPIAEKCLNGHIGIVDNNGTKFRTDNDDIIDSIDLLGKIFDYTNDVTTTNLGVLIECIKNAKYVIGNVKSEYSHLALLLGTPLIQIKKKLDVDHAKLLNPLNTPIITANSIQEGVNIYEDSI